MNEGEDINAGQILDLIKDMQVVHLATMDGETPRVRPLTMVRYGSEHFILTGTNDAKMKQLSHNDNVELCIDVKDGKGNGYLRIDGKMEVVKDPKIRSDVALSTSYFSEYWSTPEDPSYALLRFRMRNLEYMKPGDNFATKLKLI
ncbi:MAG: pyridoxamine 5'-phosphate oxidase family protein [Thermoplasmatota archaeon]